MWSDRWCWLLREGRLLRYGLRAAAYKNIDHIMTSPNIKIMNVLVLLTGMMTKTTCLFWGFGEYRQ